MFNDSHSLKKYPANLSMQTAISKQSLKLQANSCKPVANSLRLTA